VHGNRHPFLNTVCTESLPVENQNQFNISTAIFTYKKENILSTMKMEAADSSEK
jgi:hypothetical protein